MSAKSAKTGDFRADLEALLGRQAIRARESGYSFSVEMEQETIEAGVWLNGQQPRITSNLWGFWMAGAAIHAYPDRVLVRCQSEFFRRSADSELGPLMEAAYKRPVHFVVKRSASA